MVSIRDDVVYTEEIKRNSFVSGVAYTVVAVLVLVTLSGLIK